MIIFILNILDFMDNIIDLIEYMVFYQDEWLLVYIIEQNTVTRNFFFMMLYAVEISVKFYDININIIRILPMQYQTITQRYT